MIGSELTGLKVLSIPGKTGNTHWDFLMLNVQLVFSGNNKHEDKVFDEQLK